MAIKLIDPKNRPRKPLGPYASALAIVLSGSGVPKECPEGWQMIFDYWTEPQPIRPPKPLYSHWSHEFTRWYIEDGTCNEWENEPMYSKW